MPDWENDGICSQLYRPDRPALYGSTLDGKPFLHPFFGFLVRHGAARIGVRKTVLNYFEDIQFVHDVLERGRIRKLLDQLNRPLFLCNSFILA